tara:strand:- start:344 stop:553 length:210 start_codon:yes stop_codon:yes gene_type:complete
MASKTKKKTSLSKKIGSGIATSILAPDSLSGFEATRGFLGALLGFKDGGKVRGCGIAKRGFGKAMKRKK